MTSCDLNLLLVIAFIVVPVSALVVVLWFALRSD
jgi:hypothetical protein